LHERGARTSSRHDLKEQTFATATWLGVPLVKTPAGILVMQIVAETRPELEPDQLSSTIR